MKHPRTSSQRALLALPGLLFLFAIPACLERTVKPVTQRILTPESAVSGTESSEEDPVDAMKEKLDEDPENPKWHFELGRIYELRGEDSLAEARYRSGQELIEPGLYTGPHLYLGRVLVKKGKLRDGVAELEVLLELGFGRLAIAESIVRDTENQVG
ncbi:MAG: tetratricopeptide repeat protein, partial [Planctomycetota bacterium]